MTSSLTLIQLLCVALLIVAAPIYECLKLKWRAEEAERIASNERVRCKRLEREVAYLQHVIHDLQCSTPAPASVMREDGELHEVTTVLEPGARPLSDTEILALLQEDGKA